MSSRYDRPLPSAPREYDASLSSHSDSKVFDPSEDGTYQRTSYTEDSRYGGSQIGMSSPTTTDPSSNPFKRTLKSKAPSVRKAGGVGGAATNFVNAIKGGSKNTEFELKQLQQALNQATARANKLEAERLELENRLRQAKSIWDDMINDAVEGPAKEGVKQSLLSPEAFIGKVGFYMQIWAKDTFFDPGDGTNHTMADERKAIKEDRQRILQLEQRERELEKELSTLRQMSDTQKLHHERTVGEIRNRLQTQADMFQEEINMGELKLKERFEKEKEEWQFEKQEMEAEFRARERDLREELDRGIEEQAAGKENEIKRLLHQMDSLKMESEEQQKHMQFTWEQKYTMLDQEINQVKARHAAALKSQTSDHASAIARIDYDYKNEIASMQSAHELQITDLLDRHQRELDDTTSKSENAYKDLESKYRTLESRTKTSYRNLEMQFLEKVRWQPMPDVSFKDRFDVIKQNISTLARAKLKVSREDLGPLHNQVAFIKSVKTERDSRLVIEEALWTTLWRGIFLTPFKVFGSYGDHLQLKWCELFSRNPEGSSANTPDPSELAEIWRYSTIESLKQALDSSIVGEMSTAVQSSHKANLAKVSDTVREVIDRVSSELSNDEKQKLGEIVSLSAQLAVDMGAQRCRMQLFGVTPGIQAQALRPSYVSDRNGRNGRDNAQGTVAVFVSPGLQRIGDERGGSLEKEATIIFPAGVFLVKD